MVVVMFIAPKRRSESCDLYGREHGVGVAWESACGKGRRVEPSDTRQPASEFSPRGLSWRELSKSFELTTAFAQMPDNILLRNIVRDRHVLFTGNAC